MVIIIFWRCLLDTNIVLRLSNSSDRQHFLVTTAITTLLTQGEECYLSVQVLIELWVVATRPIDVNGLGWKIEKTRSIIDQLLDRFPLTDENEEIFSIWLNLVSQYQISGKKSHDTRIVAVMLRSGITHILTLNPKDFTNFLGITVVHPQSIIDNLR